MTGVTTESHVDIDLRDDAPIFGNGHANRWLLSLYDEAAIAEVRNRRGAVTRPGRPVAVRIVGPIEGSRTVTDPAVLRREGERLLRAAELLQAAQEASAELVLEKAQT